MADAGKIILNQGDAPGAPDTGKIAVYSKTDDKLYYKTDDGVEHEVTASGGGATTLIELTDTPSTYDSGKYLKSTADGTEWATVSGGSGSATFIGLTDTPDDYSNTMYLRSTTSGLEWVTLSGAGTTDHSLLSNLDYASANHTGFQPAGDYATDADLTTLSGNIVAQIPTDYYTTGEVDDIISTTSGTLQAEIDNLESSVGGVVYWMVDSAADIPTYEYMYTTPSTGPEDSDAAVCSSASGEVLIDAYVTASGSPGTSVLPGGLWDFNIYASVDNATGVSKIVVRVYKRAQGGTETELFNITTTEINALTATLYNVKSYHSDFALLTTDRVVIKYYGITTSVADRTITMYYEGDTNYTHVHTPVQAIIISDHSELTNLDYASAGHTGFQPAGDYATDAELTSTSGILQTQISQNISNIDTNNINLTTHSGTANIHFLATEVDHNDIVNTHNLSTDIDHDQLTNYDAARHFLVGDIDHGSIAGLSDDDHTQYHNDTRGDVRYYTQSQVDTLIGQATYSGSGLVGTQAISNASDSVFVDFGQTLSGTGYFPTLSIENTVDANPSQYGYTVTSTTVSGFTILLSGLTDSANYIVNWRVGNDAINLASIGLTSVSEDTAPALGGNLNMAGFTIGGVTPTEIGYVSGVTSAIQTQLGAKLENVVEDTTPELGGNLSINNNSILLNNSPTSNLTGNGIIISGVAGSAIDSASRVLYRNSSGKWEEAIATSAATGPVTGISLNAADTDEAVSVLLMGVIRNDGWGHTAGQVLYLAANLAGYVTATAPSTTGYIVQRVGIALNTTIVYFNPDLTIITVT